MNFVFCSVCHSVVSLDSALCRSHSEILKQLIQTPKRYPIMETGRRIYSTNPDTRDPDLWNMFHQFYIDLYGFESYRSRMLDGYLNHDEMLCYLILA